MGLDIATLNMMLKDAGVLCSVSGSATTFYGVFNAETKVVKDETGDEVVLIANSLTVTTELADTLDGFSKVLVGAIEYQVNDRALASDGSLTRLILA